eukprot:SAG11_NODE_1360_length_5112_cov_4.402952_4_plen_140_part_00
MGWHHQKLLLLDSLHAKHRNTDRATDLKRKSSRCRFDELTLKTVPVHTCGEGLVTCRVLEMPHVPASPKDRRGFNRVDQSVEDFPAMTTAHVAAAAHTKGTVMNSNWKPIHQEGRHAASVPAYSKNVRPPRSRRSSPRG